LRSPGDARLVGEVSELRIDYGPDARVYKTGVTASPVRTESGWRGWP
jgi:putative component of toxin-antitoxin plasmid stabilization module